MKLGDKDHLGDPEVLSMDDRFEAPLQAAAVAWLDPKPGSLALDAGRGAGGMVARLAMAVGETGRVTALDVDREQLARARRTVEASRAAAAVEYVEGDLAELPFPDERFDLAWSGRVVHGLPDRLAGAREVRRVLAPGGRFALREGGGFNALPFDVGIGEPGPEARLKELSGRWFAAWRASLPEGVHYPFGWPGLLADAGFRDVAVKTFVMDLLPPFDEGRIRYPEQRLRSSLDRPEIAALIPDDDRELLELLTDPASSHYAPARPDLHVAASMTVYVGRA